MSWSHLFLHITVDKRKQKPYNKSTNVNQKQKTKNKK